MATVAIACKTIEDEINSVANDLPDCCPLVWVESGLHNYPSRLRDRLQEEIYKLLDVDYIVLIFGYCGNSVEGLISPNAQLIIPKVDDCISMLLGGNEVRLEESRQRPSYYLTDGWMRYENNIYQEYLHCREKYGSVRTQRIFRAMLEHYTTLNFIDTGTYSLDQAIAKTAELAAAANLEQQVISGDLTLIAKALRGEWDDDFLRVGPGVPVHISCGISKGDV